MRGTVGKKPAQSASAVFSIMETIMNQKSIHTVYVLNKDGKPLMPTRPAKAKWLLKNGKAKVVRRSPFTIQLTYQIENPILQPASLAFDDGETVGVAVIVKNKTHQRVVFWAQMRCRGKEINELLSRRKKLRKARRKRKWNRHQKTSNIFVSNAVEMNNWFDVTFAVYLFDFRWKV